MGPSGRWWFWFQVRRGGGRNLLCRSEPFFPIQFRLSARTGRIIRQRPIGDGLNQPINGVSRKLHIEPERRAGIKGLPIGKCERVLHLRGGWNDSEVLDPLVPGEGFEFFQKKTIPLRVTAA